TTIYPLTNVFTNIRDFFKYCSIRTGFCLGDNSNVPGVTEFT
ncbi:unnamed protein product, partial [marine sediment metagenome]